MINRRSEHPMPREGLQPGAAKTKLQSANGMVKTRIGAEKRHSDSQPSGRSFQLDEITFRHA
jgi:hypothetical protein